MLVLLMISAVFFCFSSEGMSQTLDYSMIKGHPRLLMSDDDFCDLRRKITVDRPDNQVLADVHDLIIGYAEEFLASPEEITFRLDASGKRLLPMSKRAVKQIFFWSYAYHMTGDKKYVEGVRGIIPVVCGFPNWNPKHFLDTAEMSLALAIAYDWLFDELSLKEKRMIREAIVEKAFIPARKCGIYNPKSTASTSNWNQVCNTGLVCAALVLFDKEEEICKEVIERAIPSNARALEHIYSPDGAYPEGYTYWHYGTDFNIIMLAALEHIFGHTAGLAEIPGFLKTPGHMLFMAGATESCYSYFDCIKGEAARMGMWYFADILGDPSLLTNELRLMKSIKYPGKQECIRIMPLIPCVTKNLKLPNYEIPKPDKKLWHGNGRNPVVLVHTDWTFSDTDKYLGFKGGKASQSHGHMDAGSFTYDAFGVRWSDDLGLETYTKLENYAKSVGRNAWDIKSQESMRWKVFRYNNHAHSALTVNKSDFNIKGFAPIVEVYDDAAGSGGKVDLTEVIAPEVRRAVRTLKLVDDVLYVIDEITAPDDRDSEVEWRMMTRTKVDVFDDKEILSSSGKEMILTVEVSDPSLVPTYMKWEAKRPDYWEKMATDSPNKGYAVAGYSIRIPAGKSVVLTTRLIPGNNN